MKGKGAIHKRGEAHHRARYSTRVVALARWMVQAGYSVYFTAWALNIPRQTVRDWTTGRMR